MDERTFVIVDLVGFTSATHVHGDATAADLAEQLVALSEAALDDLDILVKSIGDAVLCACVDPDAGVRFLEKLFDAADEMVGLPLLRGGAAHGSAVERGGDYFGETVNVAARLADLAGGGEVLVTDVVAAAAHDRGIEAVSRGPYRLRNIPEPIELFALAVGADVHGRVIDPVCAMTVARDHAAGRLRHDGRDHWFCSLKCVAAFAADPDAYGRAAWNNDSVS